MPRATRCSLAHVYIIMSSGEIMYIYIFGGRPLLLKTKLGQKNFSEEAMIWRVFQIYYHGCVGGIYRMAANNYLFWVNMIVHVKSYGLKLILQKTQSRTLVFFVTFGKMIFLFKYKIYNT